MESSALELSGYGYGSGYGSGDGYGSGCGYGYGYGDGSGYGSEKKKYLEAVAEPFSQPNVVVAFWRSDENGRPSNGGSRSSQAFVGKTECVDGPLRLCSENALHGTMDPAKWKGERWWIVALHEPVQKQDDKIGSLKRTILADLETCPF